MQTQRSIAIYDRDGHRMVLQIKRGGGRDRGQLFLDGASPVLPGDQLRMLVRALYDELLAEGAHRQIRIAHAKLLALRKLAKTLPPEVRELIEAAESAVDDIAIALVPPLRPSSDNPASSVLTREAAEAREAQAKADHAARLAKRRRTPVAREQPIYLAQVTLEPLETQYLDHFTE
ncbi:MAG TPA: hypothetical protein VGM88_32155 [Kofleriaceae bacterium]|jgi:pyrimidine deaminase RibD-like protein